MTLSELEALAKNAQDKEIPEAWYLAEQLAEDGNTIEEAKFMAAVKPITILQMIALIRQMEGALTKAVELRASLWRNGDFEGEKDPYATKLISPLNALKEFEHAN